MESYIFISNTIREEMRVSSHQSWTLHWRNDTFDIRVAFFKSAIETYTAVYWLGSQPSV